MTDYVVPRPRDGARLQPPHNKSLNASHKRNRFPQTSIPLCLFAGITAPGSSGDLDHATRSIGRRWAVSSGRGWAKPVGRRHLGLSPRTRSPSVVTCEVGQTDAGSTRLGPFPSGLAGPQAVNASASIGRLLPALRGRGHREDAAPGAAILLTDGASRSSPVAGQGPC